MTNAVLNVAVLAVLGLLVAPVLRRLRPGPLAWAALVMVTLTVVFDTLMIAADLYVFDPDLILGVYVWGAPVEDFAYAIAAVLLMPALWTWTGRRSTAQSARPPLGPPEHPAAGGGAGLGEGSRGPRR